MSKKIKNIADLRFDPLNINKGSEYGSSLLLKSLQEVGAGRSVLADKNGFLIAGNKTVEIAAQAGIESIRVIETTGNEIVVVQRTDLDINSVEGVKMKILDNTVSKHNYIEDKEIVERVCSEYEIEAVEYGLPKIETDDNIDDIDEVDTFSEGVNFIIRCSNIDELEELQKKLGVDNTKIAVERFYELLENIKDK